MAPQHLLDILELADLSRPDWERISAGIPAWHPRCEGEGEGAADEGAAGADEGAADDGGDDADDRVTRDDDWETKAKKHERWAKKERDRNATLQAEMEKLKKAGQTDQEKALDQARKETAAEVRAEGEKDRRSDRLEVAVTRLAAKGVKVGDETDIRFADTEDALLHVQRRLTAGDLDDDDIFDDKGKVKTDALESALGDILKAKPHLKVTNGDAGAARRASGSSDAGKGKAAEGQLQSTDGMSPGQIAKAVAEGRLNDYLASSN